jgi:hypothetical protein
MFAAKLARVGKVSSAEAANAHETHACLIDPKIDKSCAP